MKIHGMDKNLFDAIINFIKKYSNYQTDYYLAQDIGYYWHKYIFKNGNDKIILKEDITCPMKPEWIGIEPDYLNNKEDYSVSIIHNDEVVFQDSLSECMYSYFITIAKSLNEKKHITATLTDFIKRYNG